MVEPQPHRARDHRVDLTERVTEQRVAGFELGDRGRGLHLGREALGDDTGLCLERFEVRQRVNTIEGVAGRGHPRQPSAPSIRAD